VALLAEEELAVPRIAFTLEGCHELLSYTEPLPNRHSAEELQKVDLSA
jgi:hypothetical protein